MLKLGVRCVRRSVSGAVLTDFGKAVCASMLLVLSCALSPAFAQVSEVPCPVGSQAMTGSGTASTPYQVTNICQLQGISSSPAAYYVLMDNIDASETEGWNNSAGFSRILNFRGSFVNPGDYVISSLTISLGSKFNVSMFAVLEASGRIEGIRLVGSRTIGKERVGSLVGWNKGVIKDCSATGSVVSGRNNLVGGLVGLNEGGISGSSATGSVSGGGLVGGLVGYNLGDISDSYATGLVSGGERVGGLVGDSRSVISGSYATGLVSGGERVGGLVGFNFRDISDSYATGSVSGGNFVGGLAGDSRGVISDSYATGLVSGGERVGGLVGYTEGNINNSYATGSASGRARAGGLVGHQGHHSSIGNTYATGSVFGTGDNIGGLVGYLENTSSIRDSYATGSVSGLENTGGLVGYYTTTNTNSTIRNSYYTARGRNNGLGEERTFTQLRCPTVASETCPSGFQESTYEGWGTNVWVFGSTTDLPQLLSNQNPGLNLKPYIKGSADLVVGRGYPPGITHFSLEADYPGPPGESVVLTWSLLFDAESSTLSDLVYFVDLEDGTTSTEANGSSAMISVAGDDRLTAGKDFYVVLRNNVSANVDQVLVRIVGASPLVDGGRDQTRTISGSLLDSNLIFSAADLDSPGSGGAGLSWRFLSTDIAEGSTVRFSSTQRGGVVGVVVTRSSLDHFDVGSFVLAVESPVGVETTFTVTIETMCSAVPGEDLMTGQTGAGTPVDPYQIRSLCQLQDINSNQRAHYELVANIDASITEDWNNGAGFSRILNFGGSLVSTGNYVISSLTISLGSKLNVGMFAVLQASGRIEGIRLVGSRTTGNNRVGSLVGWSKGTVEGCSATGSVVSGRNNQVGGLVGFNEGGASISRSYAAGSVSGGNRVGGLVGDTRAGISDSYATGSVSGREQVGGLVGYQGANSIIRNSSATGSVVGTSHAIGGLVGRQGDSSSISDSYAAGTASGGNRVGGLVGESSRGISGSYATGLVSGQNSVGGLVGHMESVASISNSYATGSVFGTGLRTGGLVGYQRANSSISDSYATGLVSGVENVGGLVGRSDKRIITNSYYASRGRSNALGRERTFTQLRCPTVASETCPPDSQESTYGGWSTNVWSFGGATDLPQLLSNQNPDLNLKPYIKSNTGLVGTGFPPGITRFSLEADYPGTPVESVTLTWSLLFDEESSTLSGLVYFVDLEDGTTGKEANGSSVALAVAGDDRLTAGKGFYVVLKNNISADADQIPVRIVGSPNIRDDDIRQAPIGSTTTFSFSVSDTDSSDPVTLTWSLSGVPTTLRHLVYFDLGDGKTSTTFTGSAVLTDSASMATLVVVGNEDQAGRVFYVVLKNNISANDDRIPVWFVGSPIIRDDDIRPVTIGSAATFSFFVGYTGSPDPVTLTWSLSGVPEPLSDFVYFVREDGSTSKIFTDPGKLTSSASPVTLVVADNERLAEFAGEGFYVELKNNVFASVDRIPIRIAGASPLVDSGREQTEAIWDGSDRTILRFSATDLDSPGSRGAGLSWDFFSRDGVAEGSTVVFSGTQNGSVVEVEVRRDSLDLYDVGSFVLAVESPAGVKTTFTVTIEVVCSTVPGEDLMAGQTGAGTSGNPYKIRRICQLQDISSTPTAHHMLVADIDASRAEGWNSGAGFEPIASGEQGGFSGSFVSTGDYAISSLTISRSDEDNVGLFSELATGATIRGIVLVGSRTIGGNYVGSLVGSSAGVIKGCSVTGSVFGVNQVGGLVGHSKGGVRDSYATGSVSGQSNVGGLAGENEGSINSGYATGSVVGTDENIGGLVGYQGANSSIRDSYATGSVSGQSNVGGLAGENEGSINNGYATGPVSGAENIGGLVGYYIPAAATISTIRNSYYAARGQNNGLGEERTFTQLRCPTVASETCPPDSQESTYEGWGTNVWVFGSTTDLPQLLSNQNSDLNRKPYIKDSADLVVGTGFPPGITHFSLEAGYPGPPGESVVLTWSLLFDEESSTLSSLVYFVDLEDGTTDKEANGSSVTLAVVRDDLMGGKGFYVVLKNNVSADDDQIPVWFVGSPNIRDDGIRQAPIGSTTIFSFSVGDTGSSVPVTLTWSLFGVPPPPRHLVYFELAAGTTSSTFVDSSVRTGDASTVTLVVEGNEELAGRSFYVVLKNSVSANDDQIPVWFAGSPNIRDDDIRQALIGSTTTLSFSVGDTGSSGPVTLTWTLSGVTTPLRHLVYFDLGGDTTSTTFVDSSVRTGDASTATLVVVGNEELTGRSFHVVLKNNVSANVDQILVRIVGASPLVDGGRDQTRTISGGLLDSNLMFSATDLDSPGSGSAGLSWRFLSTDIAEGSTVRFSGTQRGGVVKVVVTRSSLDHFDVGSFVLAVESPAGVETTFTVTIETMCSAVPGEDLITGQTGEGTLDDPYQIKSLCQLQDINSNQRAHYELAANINASITEDWNNGAGFSRILNFRGSLVSTGNYVISSLTISLGSKLNVGMFAVLEASGRIKGIRLVGSRTTGKDRVGSLVGWSKGAVEGCSATGSVVSGGNNQAGGLVGFNEGGASISRSYATGSVSGGNRVGGLVGDSRGGISDSYATGLVSGREQVGGLAGYQGANSITRNSSATGSVVGTSHAIGGLVGRQGGSSSISDSYATGTASGGNRVGGLVGESSSDISDSYATGLVSGQNNVGGLVGHLENVSSISGSYATGSVVGTGLRTGGLVGYQGANSSISDSYATGSVSGVENVGGLVGYFIPAADTDSTIRNSYYAARERNNGLGEERTFTQLRCPMVPSETCPPDSQKSTYEGWDTNVWGFGGDTDLPQLLSNQNPDLNLKPYIKSNTGLVGTSLAGDTYLSLEADYPGPPGESVTLTWSLLFNEESSTLSGLVYFVDLEDGTTGKEANGSSAKISVAGDDRLTAGKGFYVVLKNNISANADQLPVRIVGSPNIRGDDIRPAPTGSTTTFSFSVGGTGFSGPVTLTWTLEDVPATLRHLVYFELAAGTTNLTFIDSSVLTNNASMATLVVVGNNDLAGRIFYVVLKNNVSVNGDRFPVRIGVGPPDIVRDDDIRPAPIGSTSTFSFSVDYTGSLDPVTLTWTLEDVPITLSHLVYFELAGGSTSKTSTDPGKLTSSASPVTLVVVGDERLAGEGFYVVLKNNVFASVDRVLIRIAGASPLVIGGRDQVGMIHDGLLVNNLIFSATDPDSPGSRGAGLSWRFLSTDIAEGSTIRFGNTQKGGVVEVVVTRSSLDHFDVGSFVLEVESPVGVKTTITVTIETVCSLVPGEGLALVRGSGSPNDPYRIERLCQLQAINSRRGAHYALVADIDASRTEDWNNGAGFKPIGSFGGSFVSTGNYVISSLTINRKAEDQVGLFSRLAVGGKIEGIMLDGSRTTGRYRVGSLVGRSYGVVKDSSVTGSVFGLGLVGGLVGDLNYGAIRNSCAAGSVVGTEHSIGGLVGRSRGNNIRNSYATGSVSGGRDVGGLVGAGTGTAAITAEGVRFSGDLNNNYATGSVSGSSHLGGLVGWFYGNINNSYATGSVSGYGSHVGGLGGRVFGNIGNSSATGSVSGGSQVGGLVGRGGGAGPYLISGSRGLDLAISVKDSYATGLVSGRDQVGGLAGRTRGEIENSYTTGLVSGRDQVGGLAGHIQGKIKNSSATGSVSGRHEVGGLAGRGAAGQGDILSRINGSYTTGSVVGTGDNIGGLMGQGEMQSKIYGSYATGFVSGRNNVGGLIGFSKISNTISFSYATGFVSGRNNVGGLMGLGSTAAGISNSYATGSVFGQSNVGSLMGNGGNGTLISSSYATGSVFGQSNVNGLSGLPVQGSNSYFAAREGDARVGIDRTFAQLRCPMRARADCLLGSRSREYTYNTWYTTIWGFGSSTDLPQLLANQNSELNLKPYIESSTELVVGTSFAGDTYFSLEANYPGPPGEPVTLTWSLLFDASSTLRNFVYFDLGGGKTGTEVTGSSAKVSVAGDDRLTAGGGFYVALKNNVSTNEDRVRVQTGEAPHILRKVIDPVAVGSAETFSLEVGYPTTPVGPAILAWSLSGVPSSLRDSVYFNLEGGTTGLVTNGSAVTLTVVVNEGLDELAGEGFYVVLKNGITANDDRFSVRIVGASPLVDGGRDQTRMIRDALLDNNLIFSATDSDSPYSDGAGLSWSFLSTDIAEGSTVRFSGTPRGGTVKVVVTRNSLDHYDVGSFVLAVESPAGVKTTFTVTIETTCSTEPGADLMTGQTGEGKSDDPYRIMSLCQLQDISSSPAAHYELAADINASVTEDWNGGAGFKPIASTATGGFSGSFVNAGDYLIRSLTISRSTENDVGLFSKLTNGAKMQGIRLAGSRTTGRDNVGSLVGSNAGVVEDSSVTGSVSGGDRVGGLVGQSNGNIINSYAASTVTGTRSVGGLAGSIIDGSISGSSAMGSVVGTGNNIGGLVGYVDGSISGSSATGSVSGNDEVGGLAGGADNGNIINSYAASTVTGTRSIGGLVGSIIDGSISGSSATGSVVGTGNNIGGLVGQGNGNINNSYAASTVTGTRSVGGLVGYIEGSISGSSATGSVVGTDNNIGGLVGYIEGSISGSSATGSVVGTGNNIGGLVGQGNGNINNSYAASTVTGTRSVGGLVGYIEGSISGSSATGSVVGTDNNIGGLVGYIDGSISGSSAMGSVVGTGNSIGGLVGRSISGSISNSYATGSVSGNGKVGGLIGEDYGGISNSYATGSVSGNDRVGGLVGLGFGVISVSYATGSVSGQQRVGGLVGDNKNNFSNSYATGSVFGQDRVGGLAGNGNSYINNSYATGSVFGRGNNVGGLVGFMTAGVINNSYATGSVSGDDYAGGLVGRSNGNIVNSYYAARGRNNGLGTKRSFAQLRCPMVASATCSLPGSDQRTYEDWDANVWDFGTATELPQLSSNQNSDLNLKPYINGSADLVVVIGSVGIARLSLGADYLGSPEESVTLTWSLPDVPTTLRHLVYFDLGLGTTGTTFTDPRKPTSGASTVTLVVVDSEGLAGTGFYVVLKNNISANDDRVSVRVEAGPPNIVRDDDIRPAPVGIATTFSFSVDYTGSLDPVTLTWTLEDVPTTLRHLVYFDLGNNTTSTTVTDFGKLTGSASPVTLVVVGNEELAGRSFYVVIKNNISANVDRIPVRTEVGPPNIVRDDDIRQAPVGSTTTFGFSVGYTGSSDPVTLTWTLEDVPTSLRHLVYFNLAGDRTSEMFTDSSVRTNNASPVTLEVVGNKELAGRIFYVVLKNNISANVDRIPVRVEAGPPNIVRDDDIRPAPVGIATTFSFSVDYTGSLDPVTLTWTLEDVPTTLRHLVYFELAGGSTSTTVTDFRKLTGSASPVTLVVVGNEELAGRSFYVVLKNNISANVDRIPVRTEVGPPNIVRDDDIRQAPVGSTTTFGFSVGYTGSSDPVTLTWTLEDVPTSLRHLVYFNLAGDRTSEMFTDSSVRTNNASPVTLEVVGNKELAGRIFNVVLKNNISGGVDRVMIQVQGSTAIRLRAKVYLGGAVR